ncbi:MAG: hypothetical protein JWN27_2172 [Candidatus Eremiobacteraeota bacterium]|nr:hypothetical protein [Candidatus Eremiobacteraeota bacterium]
MSAPVWPGPCLVVPVTVDCLLVGEPDRSGSTWAATAVNYQALAAGLSAVPEPFTAKAAVDAPPSGAHVMWTVPFSLRHGTQQPDGPNAGALNFKPVPNRWLVVRAYYGAAGALPVPAPALVATVIQSDALTTPSGGITPAMSQYPNQTTPGTRMTVMQIGAAVALSAWQGADAPAQPFLTAMGPADVSWSALYDDVRNVFSLYDPLTDAGAGEGTYSYSVVGWYADPASDPLQSLPVDTVGHWIAALAKKFSWSVGAQQGDVAAVAAAQTAWTAWQTAHGLATSPFDPSKLTLPPQLLTAITQWAAWQSAHGAAAPASTLPQQMLCHGMVVQIPWSGSGTSYGSGAPNKGGTTFPTVAVGNSAVEATAAWLAQTYVQQTHGQPETVAMVERAIEAMQRGFLLQLYSDPVGAEAKLHAAEFAGNAGGSAWIVVRPSDDEVAPAQTVRPRDTSGQQTIPLNAAQTAALTALNVAQRARDDAAASLVTMQSEFFALLYKSIPTIKRQLSPATQQLITAAYAALTPRIDAAQVQLTALDAGIEGARTTLDALVKGEFDVRLVSAPAVYAPSDPVVMLAGIGTDTKFAPPGTYDEGETVPCRVSGQTITGLTVAGANPVTLLATDLLGPIANFPQGQPIPKEAQDLWLELLFLDPSSAPFLAWLSFAKRGVTPTQDQLNALAAAIAQQQLAPWNAPEGKGIAPQAVAEAAGLQGVLPSVIALTIQNGTQPWTPVLMDWQVAWYPSATDPANQLATWSLDAVDYLWQGTTPVPVPAPACAMIPNPPPPKPIVLQGRTPLNPKIAADIGKALQQFNDANDPNYASLPQYVRDALDDAAGIMGRFDVMTQAMSGFTQQLITRTIAPSIDSTDAPTVKRLGNAPVGFKPVPGVDDGCPHPFFPLRAGHFTLTNVWVVDSFGQVLRGVDPSLGTALAPIRAQSLTTRPDGTNPDLNAPFVELPPRISQTARVELRLLDAVDDGIFSNSSDLTSPICGWVVPNHLDASLMVYDASGAQQGAIIKIATDVQTGGGTTGLRWDAPPGLDMPLGARPSLRNAHLQSFVDGLLQRGLTEGAAPLDTLLDHIDSVLFANTPLGPPDRNVAALLGAPLALVRAQLSLELAGLPAFDQSWASTGISYTGNNPVPPPLLSVPFGLRIGDMGFATNGVLGYFVADGYDTFYAVYGAGGQTAQLIRALRAGLKPPGGLANYLLETASQPLAIESTYVKTNHLVPMTPSGATVDVTMLVDPRGTIPVVSGILPVTTVALSPGPVSTALRAMTANFRVGPILANPRTISMPLPSEVRGKWAWVARTDVTSWSAPATVAQQDVIAMLESTPVRLSEGWLALSAMFAPKPPNS